MSLCCLQIRLLSLQATDQSDDDVVCHLVTVSLADDPEYEALSYVWGEERIEDGILVNNYRQTVTLNLREALWYLRPQYGARRIWVDAVCINQQDLQERASQVAMMGKIYFGATRAVVWLGKSEGSLVEDVKFFSVNKDAHHTNAPMDLWKCTLRGTWWDRVWTVQESLPSKDLLFHVGLESFSLGELGEYVGSLVRHLHNLKACCHKAVYRARDRIWSHISASTFLRAVNTVVKLINERNKQSNYDCLSLVNNHCHRDVTDLRDRVFAFVGMAKDVPDHFVNYTKPLDETLLHCAKSLIRTSNDVNFLCHVVKSQGRSRNNDASLLPRDSSKFCNAEALDLPTWCPDWTENLWLGIRETRTAYQELQSTFSAGADTFASISFPSDRCLGVCGLIADTIKAVGVCHTGTAQRSAGKWVDSWCRFLAQFVDDKLCSGCNNSTYSETNICTVCTDFTYCAECMRHATRVDADHLFYCEREMRSRRVFLTREALENNPSPGSRQTRKIYLRDQNPSVDAPYAEMFDTRKAGQGVTNPNGVRDQDKKETDMITSTLNVGSIADAFEDKHRVRSLANDRPWEALATQRYPHCECGETLQDAFRRTLLADHQLDGEYMARVRDEVSNDDQRLEAYGKMRERVIFTSYWGGLWFRTRPLLTPYRAFIEIPDRADLYVEAFQELIFEFGKEWQQGCDIVVNDVTLNKRLFISDKGYIGLAPAEAPTGDMICILNGGRVPFVLRPLAPTAPHTKLDGKVPSELVGEAYVHGLMHGEAIRQRDEGSLSEVDIVIY